MGCSEAEPLFAASIVAGRRALVTGGAKGIGAAIVRTFRKHGAAVAILDRDEEAAIALAAEVSAERGLAVQADASDLHAFGQAVRTACERIGGCDILVNNVGDYRRHTIDEADIAYWRNAMTINLDQAYCAIQAALPHLRRQGGSIINVGSIKGELISGGMIAYVSGKAGLAGLTRGLARDLGADRIRANTIVPGMVATEGNARYMDEATVERVLGLQCLKSVIKPEDVTNLALFLASDASAMITGQSLRIDGGI